MANRTGTRGARHRQGRVLFLAINEMIIEFSEYQPEGSALEDAAEHPGARDTLPSGL